MADNDRPQKDAPQKDGDHCVERTYDAERNRGESHEKALDHAENVCDREKILNEKN